MLRPRAQEFNKNEAPKDEKVRRVYSDKNSNMAEKA
jgi:hypothetical protein